MAKRTLNHPIFSSRVEREAHEMPDPTKVGMNAAAFFDPAKEQAASAALQRLRFQAHPVYTVIRRGEFSCKLREWNQCGPKGQSEFEYVITVEGTTLDGNTETGGEKTFLVEHYALADDIKATFSTGKWAASCEAFCGSLIHIAHKHAAGRATRIHVVIKPGAVAEIQLEWRHSQSLPSLTAQRL